FSRDWSSDVCSSDLGEPEPLDGARKFPPRPSLHVTGIGDMDLGAHEKAAVDPEREERLCGGKEGLSLTKSPLSNLDIVRVEVGLVGNELDPELLPGKTGLVLGFAALRSEEHTSELQSRENLVCRLLLEKKNDITIRSDTAVFSSTLQRIQLRLCEVGMKCAQVHASYISYEAVTLMCLTLPRYRSYPFYA